MWKLQSDYLSEDECAVRYETEQEAEDERIFIKMCGYVSDIEQIKVVYEE